MKIHPNASEQARLNGTLRQKRNDGLGPRGTFSEALKKVTEQPELAAVGAVTDIGTLGLGVVSWSRAQALATGEETLELLARWQALLADVETSEKALPSLADALADRVEHLKAVRDHLGADDPLRGSIEHLGILSAVEAARVNRGDYF